MPDLVDDAEFFPPSFGWVDDPIAVQASMIVMSSTQNAPVYFDSAAPELMEAGADETSTCCTWDAEAKILGGILKSWNQGQVGTCFPAGTRIRMADGSYKPIEKICLNDTVLTAEGNTGKVTHLFLRHEPKRLIRIKLHGHYGLAATDEHPILTRRGYVKIGELALGDEVAIPKHMPETTKHVFTASHRSWRTGLKNDVSIGRTMTFNGAAQFGRKTAVVQVAAVPDAIELTPGLGRILGLFLAEGSTDKNKIVWTFHRDEKETLVAELVGLLKSELGIEAHVQERGKAKTCRVNVHGRVWCEIFESLCGNGAGLKRLHADIASGPREFLRAVYEAWLDGDGHERDGHVQGTTVSHDLALSMFDIANSLGLCPAVRRCDPALSHGVKSRQRRYDVVCSTGSGKNPEGHGRNKPDQDDRHVWRTVRSIESEDFSGDVFNIEVEGDNSYVAEGIGVHNCVSFGWGRGAQDLLLCEVASGEAEEWPGHEVATEPIYGLSRVEVGGGRISGDGSVGAWAARAVKDWGVLLRKPYGNVDLSVYSESLSRAWGRSGLPDNLEPEARLHPVTQVAMVTRAEEAWAALGSFYPIPICSNQGFTTTLDQGFCRPSGSWAHCYTGNTLIAGPTFKKIQDVRVGDIVYDHTGARKKVVAVNQRPYLGALARIKALGAPAVEMTEDHPVLVYRQIRKQVPVAVTIGFVEEAKESPWLEGPRKPTYAPCWVMASKVRPGDFLVTPSVQKTDPVTPEWVVNGPQAQKLPDLKPSSELAWLFGFLVGDASFAKGHKVSLKISRSKPWRRAIEALRLFGINVTMKRFPTFVEIVAYSSVLADSCREWFLGEFGRHVPGWMFSWDTEAFMEGLADADGCRVRSSMTRVTTVSPVLAQQIKMMLIGQGCRPTIRAKKPGNGAYANGKLQYEIEWGGNRSVLRLKDGLGLVKVQSVMLVHHHGDVFNFEVEDTNSYVAGGFATHNCMLVRARFTHPSKGRCFVIQNSWGSYLRGERKVETKDRGTMELPEGCFAVTFDVLDSILRQKDSFTMAGFQGWKRRKIDWTP